LATLGARFRAKARTAPRYRFYDLGGAPARPGMVRCSPGRKGGGIVGEVFDLPLAAMGAFMAQIPAPLSIGTVELDDGSLVKGFLCEAFAAEGCKDITRIGDWRKYKAGAVRAKRPIRP